VSKHWLFVRVETDDGVVGWGESYTYADREKAIEAYVHELGRYLIDTNAFDVKAFTHRALRDFAAKRPSMDLYCAISGIEQALWDAIGKAVGQPVYNLCGGRCRSSVRVYANGWIYDEGWERLKLDESANRAKLLVEKGFTALKFDPFIGPWRPFISRAEEDAAVACVRAIREAVGPEIDLLIEVHRRLAPSHAVRIARRLEEFDPFWYEEPVICEDLSALRQVRRRTRVPIVAGEACYGKVAFRTLMQSEGVDIINPDVGSCGGVSELLEIAAMAEAHLIGVAPHNYNSTAVALAATVQAAVMMPNFIIAEYFVDFEDRSNEMLEEGLRIENGYVEAPSAAGFGIELDEAVLARYGYRQFPRRRAVLNGTV
jgi:galactonate dehydratase